MSGSNTSSNCQMNNAGAKKLLQGEQTACYKGRRLFLFQRGWSRSSTSLYAQQQSAYPPTEVEPHLHNHLAIRASTHWGGTSSSQPSSSQSIGTLWQPLILSCHPRLSSSLLSRPSGTSGSKLRRRQIFMLPLKPRPPKLPETTLPKLAAQSSCLTSASPT